MSVRTWVTISALVLAALGAAFAVRALSPIRPPEVVATAGRVRLHGVHQRSCWAQRDGQLRCTTSRAPATEAVTLPARGTIRLVAVFPLQPPGGRVTIRNRAGLAVVDRSWTAELPYELPPGAYTLVAEARWTHGSFVRWAFPFRVR